MQPIGPIEFCVESSRWARPWRKNGCVGNGHAGYSFRVSDFDFCSEDRRNGEVDLIASFTARYFRNACERERILTGFGDLESAFAAVVMPLDWQRYAVEHGG